MKKTRKSFTIVEVIASLVILSVVVGFGAFLVSFYAISHRASQRIVALNFARETMEELYSNTGVAAGGDVPLPAWAANILPNAARTTTVVDQGHYAVVSVTVTWD